MDSSRRVSDPGDKSVGEPTSDARALLARFAPRPNDLPLLRWVPELAGSDGAGVVVALLDGGLHVRHPALAGARIRFRDFTGTGPADRTGHGTRGAALLVSRKGGVAPGCDLLFGKVLVRGRMEATEPVAQAIRWAVDSGAHVIALPLGRRRHSRRVTRELARAAECGCRSFAAAGNRGPDVLLFPAAAAPTTAVSGARADGTPLPWCCQTGGVDVWAPGAAIGTAAGSWSGSSPATVLAAAVATLTVSVTGGG